MLIMRNHNGEPSSQKLSYLDIPRLPPSIDKESFLESLQALQVPCPWGDLTKGEGFVNFDPRAPELKQIPYVPLGLAVGAGETPYMEAYESIASVEKFGRLIYSDRIDPATIGHPENYVRINLTDPANINLFGFKVHALMSIGVFTYDGFGVTFMDSESELGAAKALADLVMPGGIVVNDNLDRNVRRFEEIFQNEFGFKLVKDGYSIILQKPFEKT